jgi:energy-coupling factor transport system ATP-binding protein
MPDHVLLSGPNFSGRSEALRMVLRRPPFRRASFFVGPYAEAALSGLSSTLADEIAIYRGADRVAKRPEFSPLEFQRYVDRKPQTLSGGEQVLLALHCFSLSAYDGVGIDTALEQLDAANRKLALEYLDRGEQYGVGVVLIDNRVEEIGPQWTTIAHSPRKSDYDCDLAALADALVPHRSPAISLEDLDFSYGRSRHIFRDVNLTLVPGNAYRLLGPNGAGKTTFLKILVGVLRPSRGRMSLDETDYQPARDGNRAFALATQNPDHQWCGATLREDISRRRSSLAARGAPSLPGLERLALLAYQLGIHSLDVHLYELPLAARKRLSWLWAFSGAAPWIMLDEPTVGQDRETRMQLAVIVRRLCALGYSVIFVTHDDDFAACVPHHALAIADRKITQA